MYPNIIHMDWQKHIKGSQMMDPADSKGHVFSFSSNMKSKLVVLTVMSWQILDELPWNRVHTFMSASPS